MAGGWFRRMAAQPGGIQPLPPAGTPDWVKGTELAQATSWHSCFLLGFSLYQLIHAWFANRQTNCFLQVCGDAVLVLPAHPEAAAGLQDRVASLAAKHTAGSPPRRHSSKRPSVDSPTDQQQLLQRLLRQPAVEASAPGDLRLTQRVPAEVVQPAAPGTPRLGEVAGPSSCSSSSIGMTDGQPLAATAAAAPHEQWGQLEREAACQRRQQRQQGQQAAHEVRVFECEPRQALLWSIAGRATSLSWQSGGTAVAAVAAGGGPSPAAGPGHDSLGRASAAAASATPPGASPLQAAPSPDLERPLAAAKPPQPAAKQRSNRSSLERSPWADLQPEVLGMILAQAGHGAELARAASQVCRSWRQGLAAERGALQQLRFATLRWLGDDAAGCDSCSPGSSVAGRSGRCGRDTGALDSSSSSRRSSSGGSLGHAQVQLPWLVQLAVKAGNLAATVAAARFLESTLWALQAHHASEKQAQQSGGDECLPAREAASWRGHAGLAGHAGHEADLARLWARAAKLGHPEGQWKIGYAHYKVSECCAAPGTAPA